MTKVTLWDFEKRKKVFILAEIGNNYNGNLDTAKKLIRAVAQTGADGVKFQTFHPEILVHKDLPVLAHAQGKHKTQLERLKSLKLECHQFLELKSLADELRILFLSTPLDEKPMGTIRQEHKTPSESIVIL